MTRAFSALAFALIVGSVLLTAADVTRSSSVSPLYVLGDNLFAFGALLSVALAISLAAIKALPDETVARVDLYRCAALAAALIVPALTLIYYHQIFTLEMLASLMIGLAIAAVLLSGALPLTTDALSHRISIHLIYLLLALVITAGIALRLIAPGSSLLTWIVAPLFVLVAPGLSLAQVLLPERGLIEQIGFAVPLSLGAQLIVILWLDLLGVTIIVPLLFASAGAITLAGFLGAILRARGQMPG